MAEPISLTASIVTVAALAATSAKVGQSLIRTAKGMKVIGNEIAFVARQLSTSGMALHIALKTIQQTEFSEYQSNLIIASKRLQFSLKIYEKMIEEYLQRKPFERGEIGITTSTAVASGYMNALLDLSRSMRCKGEIPEHSSKLVSTPDISASSSLDTVHPLVHQSTKDGVPGAVGNETSGVYFNGDMMVDLFDSPRPDTTHSTKASSHGLAVDFDIPPAAIQLPLPDPHPKQVTGNTAAVTPKKSSNGVAQALQPTISHRSSSDFISVHASGSVLQADFSNAEAVSLYHQTSGKSDFVNPVIGRVSESCRKNVISRQLAHQLAIDVNDLEDGDPSSLKIVGERAFPIVGKTGPVCLRRDAHMSQKGVNLVFYVCETLEQSMILGRPFIERQKHYWGAQEIQGHLEE
ncbi:hypothetical protein S7711_11319 [Stachybotrys chartarum IBT 7711]|uniref:Fungal N-terminal domain-containing protein n=1 Tax=Stachybotrys chartarum (strain CBS 109288 / IBT 7711) TaxID=1280523 RepID=A0A084ATB0_STACB|nr:hypothetical protein S7711_11319 [Stachybotrys chartarum IBT 7711]